MKHVVILAALGLAADTGWAADVARGGAYYAEHCATCHGVDLDGAGPMAGVLTIKPTDLTALARRNAGLFPTQRVAERIDGRDPLVAHGSPMPVYGFFFEGPTTRVKLPEGGSLKVSRPVADLLAYIGAAQD
ncbi:c-type cytochrome [Shimia sp. SDUM112013]|uniref:c-type cytochrome n=1 Tax=Shimia sp. SDUM112013 TaxID=3136160 RepID=UPI0032EAC899